MIKICKKCYGKSIQKFGKTDGRQRYKCMNCGYIFRSSRRISVSETKKNQDLFLEYSIHKQTLSELADDSSLSVRTIHRKLTSIFKEKIEISQLYHNIRLNPYLSQYTSSILILDATFFGRK
jgi:transposase-like protein